MLKIYMGNKVVITQGNIPPPPYFSHTKQMENIFLFFPFSVQTTKARCICICTTNGKQCSYFSSYSTHRKMEHIFFLFFQLHLKQQNRAYFSIFPITVHIKLEHNFPFFQLHLQQQNGQYFSIFSSYIWNNKVDNIFPFFQATFETTKRTILFSGEVNTTKRIVSKI